MPASGYTVVNFRSTSAMLASTDPDLVKWAAEEMSRLLPGFAVTNITLASGDPYVCYVESTQVKPLDVMDLPKDRQEQMRRQAQMTAWTIFGELGRRGWEPFLKDEEGMHWRYLGQ